MDLHSALRPGYARSEAKSIEVVGYDLWIADTAYASTGHPEAVLWHNVIPEPPSILAMGSGLLVLGDLVRRRRIV